ncbi:MAG: hypothetical protein A2219_00555 [Elusimicrobia bacterium RIFOXYA2_FULL_50_26]|nr:MAG: hypothetical protein A2219_00555 [Elusimicrobia bacterium RIFOXYA2_FULL_50_26]OGS25250.1 MAG: hypothetical protein A2314_09590 [Elusimicrobia bacterium RIFOXYB2_FULL_50_12]
MNPLRVGFTYDAKADYPLAPGDAPDKYAEFDSEQTLSEIVNSLKSGGHTVDRIGHVKSLLKRLVAGERWDIVFNIAEGLHGRNRESQVPAILELFDIPFVGSDALAMGITLDKAVAKMAVRHHGLATPDFVEVLNESDLNNFRLKYPVIVKPSEEGTSKGLSHDSIARTFEQAKEQALKIVRQYNQPALVEEFITGQEFTVAVIGNGAGAVALEPVQISIMGNVDLKDEFYTHARVENNDIKYLCPAPAGKKLLDEIRELARGTYIAVGCRDFGRIDIRVDEAGRPYFLECNALPNLGLIDVFPLVAKAEGTTYEALLCRILDHARKRYGV